MKKLTSIILIGLLATSVTFTGCSSTPKTNSSTTASSSQSIESSESSKTVTNKISQGNEKIDEVEKNIEVKAEALQSGQICAFITNKNSIIVDDIELEIVFYDSDNKPVATESDGHDVVLPDATVVSEFDVPQNYDHFETNVTAELKNNSRYKNHTENIELVKNIADGKAIVQIKNNDPETIDEIEIIAVFYQEDKIVSVSNPEDISNLRSGKTETVELKSINRKKFEYIPFDEVEIFINQAHTF